MNEYVRRNLGFVVVALGLLLVTSVVVALLAMQRTADLSSDLDTATAELSDARADLAALTRDFEQVQGGTALFAAQVTAFQDQLSALAPSVAVGIGEAIGGLDEFASSTLEFQVPINEEVPINMVIDLNRTITIPIQTSIPIDETVDTTITIAGPFGVDIPLNVTVPVQLTLPVDLEVSFPINEQIPISTRVPINLDLPIAIEIADTELATLVASLRVGLASMQDILGGLG